MYCTLLSRHCWWRLTLSVLPTTVARQVRPRFRSPQRCRCISKYAHAKQLHSSPPSILAEHNDPHREKDSLYSYNLSALDCCCSFHLQLPCFSVGERPTYISAVTEAFDSTTFRESGLLIRCYFDSGLSRVVCIGEESHISLHRGLDWLRKQNPIFFCWDGYLIFSSTTIIAATTAVSADDAGATGMAIKA